MPKTPNKLGIYVCFNLSETDSFSGTIININFIACKLRKNYASIITL